MRRVRRVRRATQGPQGPQGPAGTAGGLSGWEIVTKTTAFSGTGDQTATASCGGTKVAVGGGMSSTTSASHLYASYPSASKTWTVGFDRVSGSGAYSVTVYVICANQA